MVMWFVRVLVGSAGFVTSTLTMLFCGTTVKPSTWDLSAKQCWFHPSPYAHKNV